MRTLRIISGVSICSTQSTLIPALEIRNEWIIIYVEKSQFAHLDVCIHMQQRVEFFNLEEQNAIHVTWLHFSSHYWPTKKKEHSQSAKFKIYNLPRLPCSGTVREHTGSSRHTSLCRKCSTSLSGFRMSNFRWAFSVGSEALVSSHLCQIILPFYHWVYIACISTFVQNSFPFVRDFSVLAVRAFIPFLFVNLHNPPSLPPFHHGLDLVSGHHFLLLEWRRLGTGVPELNPGQTELTFWLGRQQNELTTIENKN